VDRHPDFSFSQTGHFACLRLLCNRAAGFGEIHSAGSHLAWRCKGPRRGYCPVVALDYLSCFLVSVDLQKAALQAPKPDLENESRTAANQSSRALSSHPSRLLALHHQAGLIDPVNNGEKEQATLTPKFIPSLSHLIRFMALVLMIRP
jgi:hypothetical protein